MSNDGDTQPRQDSTSEESAANNSLLSLRAEYKRAMTAFLSLGTAKSKIKARTAAFHDWQGAALEFFNSHDRAVAVASRDKTDRDTGWYTELAETALNLLVTISHHYSATFDQLHDLGLVRTHFVPSPTAYANLQRIATDALPKLAKAPRAEFVRLGLPTHGFDTPASEKHDPGLLPWRFYVIGCYLLFVVSGLAITGFVQRDMSPDQRWIIKVFFPLVAGFVAGCFSGSVSVKGNNFGIRATVAATGGFGVWLLTYFLIPAS